MMAATPLTVQEVDQEIRMYEEHIKFKCEQKAVRSELTKSKKPVSDGHILELRLDIDELQELHFVSTWPHVKKILSSTVSKLEDIPHIPGLKWKGNTEKGRKWSDVVADREPQRIVKNLTSILNTETMITSRPAQSTNFDIRRKRKKSNLEFIQAGVNMQCHEFIYHHE